MEQVKKSDKLRGVCYDIRGPVLQRAQLLEEEGHQILKLNLGNLAAFGFTVPEEVQQDVISNLSGAAAYSDSRGLFPARKAVMQYAQQKGIYNVKLENIFIGNGVSELIGFALQALLNNGDEVLVPSPDYPLWTAAVSLCGGRVRHYICDEESGWLPDLKDLSSKISAKTRAVVLINPNNPTGAVYPAALLEEVVVLARTHGLVVMSDEVYDKIIYDPDVTHTAIASLADDVLFLTFSGLSKNYRACGYRAGWLIVSGKVHHANSYLEGLGMLTSMRLCANVPGQYAIQTALGGYQSILELTRPGGRLHKQREYAWSRIMQIPGVSCVKPQAALYLYLRLDPLYYPIQDDEQFVLNLLIEEKLLIVQGSGFNGQDCCHFRLVFLPNLDDLEEALNRFERFLGRYHREYLSP